MCYTPIEPMCLESERVTKYVDCLPVQSSRDERGYGFIRSLTLVSRCGRDVPGFSKFDFEGKKEPRKSWAQFHFFRRFLSYPVLCFIISSLLHSLLPSVRFPPPFQLNSASEHTLTASTVACTSQ